VELAAADAGQGGARGVTHGRQQGLPRQDDRPVARELGEDVDFLFDVDIEMEPEDAWVQGLDDESVTAFTGFGVDSLIEIHRETTSPEER
jgi:hypothetical protein